MQHSIKRGAIWAEDRRGTNTRFPPTVPVAGSMRLQAEQRVMVSTPFFPKGDLGQKDRRFARRSCFSRERKTAVCR